MSGQCTKSRDKKGDLLWKTLNYKRSLLEKRTKRRQGIMKGLK